MICSGCPVWVAQKLSSHKTAQPPQINQKKETITEHVSVLYAFSSAHPDYALFLGLSVRSFRC